MFKENPNRGPQVAGSIVSFNEYAVLGRFLFDP